MEKLKFYKFYKIINWGLGIGDWGWGFGDWGLGPIPNPQSPIPNPQSLIPIRLIKFIFKIISRNFFLFYIFIFMQSFSI